MLSHSHNGIKCIFGFSLYLITGSWMLKVMEKLMCLPTPEWTQHQWDATSPAACCFLFWCECNSLSTRLMIINTGSVSILISSCETKLKHTSYTSILPPRQQLLCVERGQKVSDLNSAVSEWIHWWNLNLLLMLMLMLTLTLMLSFLYHLPTLCISCSNH